MYGRRRFLRNVATGLAGAQLAVTGLAEAQSNEITLSPSGGTHTSFAALKQIDAGLLRVGYAEAAAERSCR